MCVVSVWLSSSNYWASMTLLLKATVHLLSALSSRPTGPSPAWQNFTSSTLETAEIKHSGKRRERKCRLDTLHRCLARAVLMLLQRKKKETVRWYTTTEGISARSLFGCIGYGYIFPKICMRQPAITWSQSHSTNCFGSKKYLRSIQKLSMVK